MLAVPADAQQIPNLSQDQLQQLQQLQQLNQQSQGGSGQNGASPQSNPDITLQPANTLERQAPLPPSRLEQILSARAGITLKQFGYDQLGTGRAVTVPLAGGVQNDYILGPGDQLVVSLRGQESYEFPVEVNRDGQVVLPRLNPILATGRTLESFRQDVQAAVGKAYVATNAFVSLGRIRQISVQVSGEVNQPGLRTVTGLNSVMDALLLSGGVKKTGTLRNIRVQRGGRTLTVDLYSDLTSSGNARSLRLTDGDRILVPPLGPTVTITGLVRQPGIFELPPGQSSMSVRALLSLAGGQEVRGRYRLSLLQIQPDGQSQMVPVSNDTASVRDSEILFVQLGADQTTSQATLSGGTGLAGQYPIVEGTKLSDVLRAPGALGTSPYTLFGIIARRDPRTLLRTLAAFTPVAVMNGREDMSLQSDDIIRVLSVTEMQIVTAAVNDYNQQLTVEQEAVRNPLANSAVSGATGSAAGALTAANSYSNSINTQRNNTAILANQPPIRASRACLWAEHRAGADAKPAGGRADSGQANNFQNGMQNGGINSDQYYSQFSNGRTLNPNSNGQVFAPGLSGSADQYTYVQGPNGQMILQRKPQSPARNFEEQSIQPGQFPTNREITKFGDLARQLGVDPLVLVNFMIDHRVTMDGAVRGPGTYFVGPDVELQDLVQAAGGTINWADESGVEVISTAVNNQNGQSSTQRLQLPLKQGQLANYIVQPRDQFRFNQVFTDTGVGSVTVQGEVRFAGTYQIVRGEHLSELLARAGGLTSAAYPNGTIFLRKSAAVLEHDGYVRAAAEIESQLLTAMTHVGSDRLTPDAFGAVQGFVDNLRNQKALGRISIKADPSVLAAHPNEDPLLEAGDVIYIPQRPSTISVLGEVMQQGSFPYDANASVEDYIQRAGGTTASSDSSLTFVVLPDGTARKVETSWLNFSADDLPPGSAIVVPRDVAPFSLRQAILDLSQVFSQLAVSAASIVVLTK